MTGSRRVTRASSLAASEGAQAAPSASAPKTPGGRSKKGGSTVARQSVVSKTTQTYGSKGADQYIPQNTAGKSKEDITGEFPDTTSAHGSSSGDDIARSNRRATRSDKGNVALNTVSGNMPEESRNPDADNADNATALNLPADITLRNTNTEGEGRTSFHPNLKAWIGAIIAVLLIFCLSAYPPTSGGSKHLSVPTDNTILNQDALIQRLDHLEARISEYENYIPAIEQVSVAEQYQVDYFDPRQGAVTWPKYTSPEKMRKVGGWMGFFQKQVPLSEVPKIIGPFPSVRKMWCAPSVHGKAQVTVLLPGTMIPKRLVIEQAQTKAQSLDGHPTYPRGVELYAQRLHHAAQLPLGEKLVSPEGNDDQGRQLAQEQVLPNDFELIGAWKYDNDAGVVKQSFIPQKSIVTSTVAVRVVSNWGDAEQICLHSLQLFGENVDN